jgi:hypothetical protein
MEEVDSSNFEDLTGHGNLIEIGEDLTEIIDYPGPLVIVVAGSERASYYGNQRMRSRAHLASVIISARFMNHKSIVPDIVIFSGADTSGSQQVIDGLTEADYMHDHFCNLLSELSETGLQVNGNSIIDVNSKLTKAAFVVDDRATSTLGNINVLIDQLNKIILQEERPMAVFVAGSVRPSKSRVLQTYDTVGGFDLEYILRIVSPMESPQSDIKRSFIAAQKEGFGGALKELALTEIVLTLLSKNPKVLKILEWISQGRMPKPI